MMGVNATINAIDIYNLVGGDVLSAMRSGATVAATGDRLTFWQARSRPAKLWSYTRRATELLLCHQINRFETGAPLALAVLHVKPAALEDILVDMRLGR